MKLFLFTSLLFIFQIARAQTFVYDNQVYQSSIKTVQFYNTSKEGSFPAVALRSSEQVLLAFDDLTPNSRSFSYTIEHCDADWQPSRISPTEYLQSFTEDRLQDYRYSAGTRQKYVHYELLLPNQQIAPKIPGNYLLKVYPDGDPANPVITRRLYVYANRVGIGAEVVPSPNTLLRNTSQKINFELDYGSLNVQNPYNDIRAVIMQNADPHSAILNTRPQFIRGSQLIYGDINANEFAGGNEFRTLDLRSLRLNSLRVEHIYRDTANTVTLLTDHNRDVPNYVFQYDNDGSFFINNQDNGRDPRTDADYAHVYFYLAANKTDKEGAAYLVGQFNNYRLDADSKMDFDNLSNRFYTSQYLKQGVYDFKYIWVDASSKKPDDTLLEGSHFETENEYQLLVYYRPAGGRWDELVGYRLLNTVGRR